MITNNNINNNPNNMMNENNNIVNIMFDNNNNNDNNDNDKNIKIRRKTLIFSALQTLFRRRVASVGQMLSVIFCWMSMSAS